MAVSLIELGRGGRMNVGQFLRRVATTSKYTGKPRVQASAISLTPRIEVVPAGTPRVIVPGVITAEVVKRGFRPAALRVAKEPSAKRFFSEALETQQAHKVVGRQITMRRTRDAGRLVKSSEMIPSHEGIPGAERLDRMVGVPHGFSHLAKDTLPPVNDWTPGPAYYPGTAPPPQHVRPQISPTDIYAMSEKEINPMVRAESRTVGQAEEAVVKEGTYLPTTRPALPEMKVKPAPLPLEAKIGIGLAIAAGLTTVFLGIRHILKEN